MWRLNQRRRSLELRSKDIVHFDGIYSDVRCVLVCVCVCVWDVCIKIKLFIQYYYNIRMYKLCCRAI